MEEETPKRNHVWIKLTILLVFLGGIPLLFLKSDLFRFFLDEAQILGFLDSLGPWAFAGFIAIQAAQVVLAPIPGDVTGFLGGYLYGPIVGTILSTVGLTIGSYVAFALSRTFGKPFAKRFVPKAALDRFDYLLHHKGAFIIFLLFLVPSFPKDYLCYILGLGNLSTTEFLVIGGTGRLFGTLLLSMVGNCVRRHQYVRFSIVLVIAAAVLLTTFAYRHKIERFFRLQHLREIRRKRRKCPSIPEGPSPAAKP